MTRKILALAMTFVIVTTNRAFIYASGEGINLNKQMDSCEVFSKNEKLPNLKNGLDEDGSLVKKLEYDADKDATELPNEMEESLNEVGVFDEDINSLSEETRDDLSKASSIGVQIEYTEMNETNESNLTEVEKVNSLVEDCIDNDLLDYSEVEETNRIEDFLTSVGILPQKVYGADKKINEHKSDEKNKNYGVSSSGAVKQIIYAYQFKKGGQIWVVATAKWLKIPNNRQKDVFSVYIDNSDLLPSTFKCTHKADQILLPAMKVINKKETHPSAYVVGANGKSVAYTFDLFGNNFNDDILIEYLNDTVEISLRAKVENKNIKTVTIVTHYMHCKTGISPSPSVSLDAKGLPSIGVGVNVFAKYEEITNNPLMNYTYK